ncbi:hypothetical protein CR513_52771, partial [Mucuna pruriens]
MEHKKVLALVMLVMVYGLVATTPTASKELPGTCTDYMRFLFMCVPYLTHSQGYLGPTPPAACCQEATTAFKKAMAQTKAGGKVNTRKGRVLSQIMKLDKNTLDNF